MQLTPEEQSKLEELCAMSFDMARNNDFQNLETLLKNGLNPNLTNHKGDSLLMLASYHNSLECVKLLLQYKAEVDKANDKNLTPLSGVCYKGYAEIARLLLENGANPDFKNPMGMTPYDFAIMFRRKEILELLAKYSNRKIGFFKKLWAGGF
ncbi:ankyrin repeat domain-containing protein [Helicobacter sp. MIT 05-5294]|uniref:ankyrin repeat domain-containing protein n=1 Tax=Helicobacter sp. MIT 05-5294 TaxID=1548150 RepID=UPI0010FD7631|nr:ankyrin repeat domain-containing protein [Helicobacter sp. MIT 05-5294]TLD86157.1 ankyrin repeat domain-containing protein [Helicobacter sp. MIT 05-5294]